MSSAAAAFKLDSVPDFPLRLVRAAAEDEVTRVVLPRLLARYAGGRPATLDEAQVAISRCNSRFVRPLNPNLVAVRFQGRGNSGHHK